MLFGQRKIQKRVDIETVEDILQAQVHLIALARSMQQYQDPAGSAVIAHIGGQIEDLAAGTMRATAEMFGIRI